MNAPDSARRPAWPVLAGVKAKPCGWPAASLDPDSGRASQRPSGSPVRQNQVSTVRGDCRYIDQHLHDPTLTPEIAATAGISTHYLHKLFESHGQTVSEYVREAGSTPLTSKASNSRT